MEKENMSIAEKLKQRADAQWKAKYPENEPVNSGNANTRGLVVGGAGVLAKFVGTEVDRTAQNAREQQAKQQVQVNQANTEEAINVDASTQQANGTSIVSPVQEQVANAIGLRRHNDVDINLIQGMIPAKGTQLEAEKDRAAANVLKQATVPVGAAPDASKVNESYEKTRGILDKMAEQKATEFGTNPLTMLFYDLFMAPGQLALADRNIALYQQANQQYSTEAELYAKKLQYNKDLYEQYMKGKTEYFKNAMQDAMIAKSDVNYTDPYTYKAQAIGAQFDTIQKERLDYLHKRGEDLHKLFDEGKPIGIDGTKSMIARLTNDGDTGQLLLADVGSLYGRLVEHDENFDFATHQMVDTLKGKGFNNAALDTAKIIANNDMLKAKIRAVNAANQAGVAGKGAFQFWKSEFSPQMVAEVCTALDAFDGYQELSNQYALGIAREVQFDTMQYTDALNATGNTVQKFYGSDEATAYGASLSQNSTIVKEQVEMRNAECQKIINDSRSSAAQKYSAYLAMGSDPTTVPKEVVADYVMEGDWDKMALPLGQVGARNALMAAKKAMVPMYSNLENLKNITTENAEKQLQELFDVSGKEASKMLLAYFKTNSLEKAAGILSSMSSADLQERIFQLKNSREFKIATLERAKEALKNAPVVTVKKVTDQVGNERYVQETRLSTGSSDTDYIDQAMYSGLKRRIERAYASGEPIDRKAIVIDAARELNGSLSANMFFSISGVDSDLVKTIGDQQFDDVLNKVTAKMQNKIAANVAAAEMSKK